MDTLQKYVSDHPYVGYAVAGAVIAGTTVFVAKNLTRILVGNGKSATKVDCPPGSVLLVQIPRGPYAPSLSPFPLKLETYLKMTNIPYVSESSYIMSKKDKTPWIMYEGEEVADSQFSIEFLNKKFNKDLNQKLSKEDRATAEALRIMIDEHLYWCFAYFRWVGDDEFTLLKKEFGKTTIFPGLLLRIFSKKVVNFTYAQGIGRHSVEEILHILRSDLQVLSDYLGNKEYIMGSSPCEVDCSAFGLLSQLMWHDSNRKTKDIMREEFPSLAQYCERIKEKFWPDWDDCITHGGTRIATK